MSKFFSTMMTEAPFSRAAIAATSPPAPAPMTTTSASRSQVTPSAAGLRRQRRDGADRGAGRQEAAAIEVVAVRFLRGVGSRHLVLPARPRCAAAAVGPDRGCAESNATSAALDRGGGAARRAKALRAVGARRRVRGEVGSRRRSGRGLAASLSVRRLARRLRLRETVTPTLFPRAGRGSARRRLDNPHFGHQAVRCGPPSPDRGLLPTSCAAADLNYDAGEFSRRHFDLSPVAAVLLEGHHDKSGFRQLCRALRAGHRAAAKNAARGPGRAQRLPRPQPRGAARGRRPRAACRNSFPSATSACW